MIMLRHRSHSGARIDNRHGSHTLTSPAGVQETGCGTPERRIFEERRRKYESREESASCCRDGVLNPFATSHRLTENTQCALERLSRFRILFFWGVDAPSHPEPVLLHETGQPLRIKAEGVPSTPTIGSPLAQLIVMLT